MYVKQKGWKAIWLPQTASVLSVYRAISCFNKHVLQILGSNLLRWAILKSLIYFDIGFKLNGKFFQFMTAYDMFYYVKFTALFIKTTCKALSLLVLQISAV